MFELEHTRIVELPSASRIAYFETGTEHRDAPPLLLVHGSLCDFRYWEPQIAALAERRHVIAVSLPYFYPVSAPQGAVFGIQPHVDALLGLIHSRSWGQVTLVGHSRGGCVAFHAASQDPSLVDRLVLADPGGKPAKAGEDPRPTVKIDANGRPQGAYSADDPRMVAAGRVESGDIDGGLEMFVDAVSRPGYWGRSGDAFRTMARDNAATLPRQVRDVLPLYTRALASCVTVPTLIINGDKSPPGFLATSGTLAEWLPYAQRIVLRGASHGMNLTHASEFNREILSFIGD
ncbi:alpha/beta fold hydrolase [Robbsia andropogonis]|uniref:alpha/beta fold hydrolase n=1 Tax=Robbsia andropogonis TaxID=28092 RepID=UPI00046405C5|nr:alpha/beta hydrolase [Robbsia andropogonis]